MNEATTDLATSLKNLADTLADEHGYRGERNGHDPSCCQTCIDIQNAYNLAATHGIGDFDFKPLDGSEPETDEEGTEDEPLPED